MTKDEALDLALEALETELSIDWTNNDEFNASAEKMHEAIAAIKQARSAPVQEPVFWYRPVGEDGGYEGPLHNGAIEKVRKESGSWKPLYTTPPATQRQWVGLTDEEVDALWQELKDAVCLDHKTWGKAIEAKLKEKNT